MEIKFNIAQSAVGAGITGNKNIAGNSFKINDSFVSGGINETPRVAPTFSSVTSSPAVESTAPSFNLMSGAVLHNAAASSSIPAPFTPALAEQLKNLSYKNVEFFRKRNFRIPLLMSPFTKISTTEAGELLRQNQGGDKPAVYAALKEDAPLPITDRKEVDRLTAYYDSKSSATQQANLMTFLRETDNNRYGITIRGTKYSGGYAAYKYLTGIGDEIGTPGRNVDIKIGDATLLSLTPQNIFDTAALSKSLTEETGRFKTLGRSEVLYRAVSEHPAGVSVDDKTDILGAIYGNSYGDSEKKRVSRSMEQYNIIRNSAKDDKEFAHIGKLYSRFLEARHDTYWRDDSQTSALKFIIEDLKDRPDDFSQFVKLVEKRIPINGAIRMFKNLPQPVKDGEFKLVSDTITRGKLTGGEAVDLLMKPVGNSTLDERVDILNGLYKYSYESYSDKTWKNTSKAYDMIRRLSTGTEDFAKAGKMCVEMLEANNDTYWRSDYTAGIKFVVTEMKDRPEDFKAFLDLLRKRTGIKNSMEIFHNVPGSSKKIDFGKAADLFKNSPLRDKEQIAYLMEPIGDTTLQERLSIAEKIYPHCYAGSGSSQWKNCKKEMENLKSLAKDGREFVKIGGMFVDMLDANKDTYWRKNYLEGMKFIASKMKDKPDDFKVFINLLENRVGIDSSTEIYKNVESTDKNGTYRQAAYILMKKSFCSFKAVVESMKPVGNTTLEDRINILQGMSKHSSPYYNTDSWENTQSGYSSLKELCPNDRDFLKVGGMFIEMLDANRDSYWRKNYVDGMKLIASDFKDKPEEFATFVNLLKNKTSLDSAMEIYRSVKSTDKNGTYQEASDIMLKSEINWFDSTVEALKPVGGVSLKDRVSILQGIYRHCGGGDSGDKWKNTMKEYNRLKTLCSTDENFVKAGGMFVVMLDATKNSYWSNTYEEGMNIIVSDFKDKPEHFTSFINMLNNKMSIQSAIKAYRMLPDSGKDDKLENTVEILKSSRLNSPQQVEYLMKPVGDSTLKDRVEIAEGIYSHCSSNSYEDNWKYTVKLLESAKSLTHSGEDFVKLGKLFVQVLDSNNANYYFKNYDTTLEFIARNFMDNPEEFNIFTELLRNRFGLDNAVKLYSVMPENHTVEDFKSAASSFAGTNLSSTGQIELLFKPIANSTLDERIKIAEVIHSHSQGNDYEETNKKMVTQYEHLKELTAAKGDFVKVGGMFTQYLEAKNSRYYQSSNPEGLDFITAKFRDNQEDFNTFIGLMKGKCGYEASRKIYEMLPQPVKQGDYEKTADLFLKADYKYYDFIEMSMTPYGDVSLEDRVLIATGIRNHVQGGDSDDCHKNLKKLYNRLQAGCSGGDDFVKTGKLFIRMLDAGKSAYMRKDYFDGLDLIISDLKTDTAAQNAFESFTKMVGMSSAVEALTTIKKPVLGEDLPTRMRAAERVLRKDFSQAYEIMCRNIPQGDTIEDTGILLSAIRDMSGNRDETVKTEAVLQKIQQAKGSLRGGQIEKLVKAFRYDCIDDLVKTLKSLDLPGDNENYGAREDIFLRMSTGYNGITSENLKKTAEIFDTVLKSKENAEGFTQALARFGRILKFYQENKSSDSSDAINIYTKLMGEVKKGTFGKRPIDQVIDKLLGILLVANTTESAFDQLIYEVRPQEDKTIVRGESEITIGGVKLKKARKH